MSSANGNADRFNEGLVIVRVADEVNQALTGRPGCRYESPPKGRDQAMALVEVLLGHSNGSLEGTEQWSCPIAGGRRRVWLESQPGPHRVRESSK